MTDPAVRAHIHTTAAGVTLTADVWPGSGGHTVVLLHGGGQTRHAWTDTARALVRNGHTAVPVDLRGHGDSDWAPDGDYELSAIAGDIASLCDDFDDKPILVGASLGGITGLMLEGEVAPGSLRALVLVDIVPRMNTVGANRVVAFMSERMDEGFASLDDVADAIAAFNPNRPRPTDLTGLTKNLRQRDGRWFWHWDPSFIRAAQGTSEQKQIRNPQLLTDTLRRVEVPLMLVRGRQSDLVTDAEVAEFCEEFPHAAFHDVAGAGHMVAGDRNDAFSAAVVEFISTLEPPESESTTSTDQEY